MNEISSESIWVDALSRPWISIHLKLFIMVTVVLTLVLFGGFYFAINVETKRLGASIKQRGSALSLILQSSARHVFLDMESARELIDHITSELVGRDGLLGIAIHCPDMGIISSKTYGDFVFHGDPQMFEETYQKGEAISVTDSVTGAKSSYVPIMLEGKVIGVAVFSMRHGAKPLDFNSIIHERLEHVYGSDIHGDIAYLRTLAQELGNMDGVLHVMIYDSHGMEMAFSRSKCDQFNCQPYLRQVLDTGKMVEVESPETGGDYIFSPIMVDAGGGKQKLAGVIELAMDIRLAEQKVSSLRHNMAATGVVTLLVLSVMLGFFVNMIILRPIRELKAMADAVAGGDTNKRLTLDTADEFSLMAGSFNRMLDQIQKSHDEITSAHDYLDRILSYMNEGVVVITPGGRVGGANTSAYAITGYMAGELNDLKISDLFSGVELSENTKIRDICLYGEMSLRRKDGGLVPVDVSCAPMKDEAGYVFVIQDNSERKKAEEQMRLSEEKFAKAFHASPDWIVISKIEDGLVMECNEAFLEATGLEKEAAVGKTTAEIGLWQTAEARKEYVRAVMESGRVRDYETEFNVRDGEKRMMLLSADRITIGDEDCILNIGRDITVRKNNEERILAALREKEVLLREVHHRVKNNLQVIQSLLSMQAMHIGDEVTLRAFRESQDRVRSMALIHERFYRSDDLSRIDFGAYVTVLVRHMISSYGGHPSRISARIEIEGIMLSINHAIPCGIIINEIVSNAIKYAFPMGSSGEIFVSMTDDGNGNLTLTVGDDGVGVGGEIDISGDKTLGLSLVRILAEDQLNGKISISTEKGVVFKIDFAVTC